MFSALNYSHTDFATENGHCNVPQQFPPNPSLGRWVARQRLFIRRCQRGRKTLSINDKFVAEKLKLLAHIGLKGNGRTASNINMVCSSRSKEWEKHFAKLLEYKEIHGHCDVPVKSNGDFKSLGRWVTTQRKIHNDSVSRGSVRNNQELTLARFHR